MTTGTDRAPAVERATAVERACAGGRVLVAGIGNVFLGDDGFGVEVVRRLDRASLPAGVDAVDYGIRGLHLAYELLDGAYGTVILVDAVPSADPPATLTVLEIDRDDPALAGEDGAPAVDGHGMDPVAVLRMLRGLSGGPEGGFSGGLKGGRGGGLGGVERVLVIGCRPAVVEERMGLSETVLAVVDDAVRLVAEVAQAESARLATTTTARAGRGT